MLFTYMPCSHCTSIVDHIMLQCIYDRKQNNCPVVVKEMYFVIIKCLTNLSIALLLQKHVR